MINMIHLILTRNNEFIVVDLKTIVFIKINIFITKYEKVRLNLLNKGEVKYAKRNE